MKKSKAILMVVCAMLLVAASVMGTLAYLTSTPEAVVNTFTVGNVAITLDEADVDEYGYPVLDEYAEWVDRVIENTYKLVPGHEYIKDPTIHVAPTSEDCYLFVTIDNEIAEIEDTSKTVASQMEAKGWAPVAGENNVYFYIGNAEEASYPLAVSGGSDKVVFEKFTVAGDVDNDTLADYEGATITITAYAIQADSLGDKTAAEIWASFPTAPAATEPSDPETT